MSQITIQSFTGSQVAPYLSSIARLREEILSEYPYLWHKEAGEEIRYLKHYEECPESIAVIVFDGSAIVGAAMGIPLAKEGKELLKPFEEQQISSDEYFYFGKSVLLPEYRRRGLAHHFFEMREEHARLYEQFRSICFWEIARSEDHPHKPEDYLALDNFWRKRGYSLRPELSFSLSWKEVTEEEETPKELVYWTKEI